MAKVKEPRPGEKMSPQEAKAYVDYLYARMYEHWKQKIQNGPFMTQLRHHFDLLGPFCAKIADELISPKPPGHVLVLLKTAAAMKLTPKEVLEDAYLPEARAINDFCHKIFIDGSIIELWGLHVFEESLAHWSGEWFRALTTHYKFTKEQAVYFSTHEEADLEPHALGQGGEEAMGHGAFNRTVLQRALEDGKVEFRAGYSMEYCALTMVDLHAQMKRAAIDNPYP
ncbi:MAG: hypothetical protein HYS67_10545 [Deltaproteobacteria bacterium]|nr:hypothetical protein [Deltaproteobacteria bacterium]